MKSLLLAWHLAVRFLAAKLWVRPAAIVARLLYRRPALKRGLLAFGLVTPVNTLFLAAGLPAAGVLWACLLVAILIGIGAERVSTDWDDFFALPPVGSFLVWRWHALERKRFGGALVGLGLGVLLPLVAFVFAGEAQ